MPWRMDRTDHGEEQRDPAVAPDEKRLWHAIQPVIDRRPRTRIEERRITHRPHSLKPLAPVALRVVVQYAQKVDVGSGVARRYLTERLMFVAAGEAPA